MQKLCLAAVQALTWPVVRITQSKMKSLTSYLEFIGSAILLSSSLYAQSGFAAGCPTPSFAAERTFDVGASPVSLAVGDFNRDGKPDLVVANQQSANVSVLLGNGDGTFQNAVNY